MGAFVLLTHLLLHGPPMLVDKTNYGLVIYNHDNFYFFEETSSYWLVKQISVFLSFSLVNQSSYARFLHDRQLVGCFGLNGPLRQYFSLYLAVSQREGERKEK